MGKSWLPLEANPEILTDYARKLGLPETLAFHDVLSVEDWALEMLPPQIYAILLLFPISVNSEKERFANPGENSSDVYYMKQTVGNACGTIAVLHSLLNLPNTVGGDALSTSYVGRMQQLTSKMSPLERGKWLADDPEIECAHASTEALGQSAAPVDSAQEVDTHFIAFIPGPDGRTVYELDGRREGPVIRSQIDDPSAFAKSVLSVIKTEFMDRNPEDIRFTILALSTSTD